MRLKKLLPGLCAVAVLTLASTAFAGGALRTHVYFTNQSNTTDAQMKDIIWTVGIGESANVGYLCPPASGGTTEPLIPMIGAPASGGNALIIPGGGAAMVGMMEPSPGDGFFLSSDIMDVNMMSCPDIKQGMGVGRIFSHRTSLSSGGVDQPLYGTGDSYGGGKGVIAGGRTVTVALKKVYQYTPERDLWTPKADLADFWYWQGQDYQPSTAKHWAFGGIYGGAITNRTVSYTASTDTWSASTCSGAKKCPIVRYGHGFVYDPVRNYFLTGPGIQKVVGGTVTVACSTSKFDSATSTWTTLTTALPGGACSQGPGGTFAHYSMAFYPKFVGPNDADGRVIVWGGFRFDATLTSTNNAYMFNPTTNAWESITQGILGMDVNGMETCDTALRPAARTGATLAYNDGPGGATGPGASVALVGGETSGWIGDGTIIRDTYVGNVLTNPVRLCWAPANQPGVDPPALWNSGILTDTPNFTAIVGGRAPGTGGATAKVFRVAN